jgi:hypothetical protein
MSAHGAPNQILAQPPAQHQFAVAGELRLTASPRSVASPRRTRQHRSRPGPGKHTQRNPAAAAKRQCENLIRNLTSRGKAAADLWTELDDLDARTSSRPGSSNSLPNYLPGAQSRSSSLHAPSTRPATPIKQCRSTDKRSRSVCRASVAVAP